MILDSTVAVRIRTSQGSTSSYAGGTCPIYGYAAKLHQFRAWVPCSLLLVKGVKRSAASSRVLIV